MLELTALLAGGTEEVALGGTGEVVGGMDKVGVENVADGTSGGNVTLVEVKTAAVSDRNTGDSVWTSVGKAKVLWTPPPEPPIIIDIINKIMKAVPLTSNQGEIC